MDDHSIHLRVGRTGSRGLVTIPILIFPPASPHIAEYLAEHEYAVKLGDPQLDS